MNTVSPKIGEALSAWPHFSCMRCLKALYLHPSFAGLSRVDQESNTLGTFCCSPFGGELGSATPHPFPFFFCSELDLESILERQGMAIQPVSNQTMPSPRSGSSLSSSMDAVATPQSFSEIDLLQNAEAAALGSQYAATTPITQERLSPSGQLFLAASSTPATQPSILPRKVNSMGEARSVQESPLSELALSKSDNSLNRMEDSFRASAVTSSAAHPLSAAADRLAISRLLQETVQELDMDVPLCLECSTTLLAEYDEILEQTNKEVAAYRAYLASSAQELVNGSNLTAHQEDLDALIKEEKRLKKELESVFREADAMAEEARQIVQLEKQLADSQQSYWLAFGKWKVYHQRVEDDLSSVQTRLSTTSARLNLLRSSVVLNDAFSLWVDGHFATVNGLRLGRISSQQVEWAEISAAVSLVAQLVAQMAKTLNYKFKSYQFVFSGPSVKLERIKDKQVLELSADPDATFIRLFANRRFDNAMTAFLNLIEELIIHVQSLDSSFKPPYNISGDKIDAKSIRMQFNSEELWTKALKFMVTEIKWILAWMTSAGFV